MEPDHRTARGVQTENTGFFERNRFAAITQPLGMIDTDTGHQREIRVNQVHRVQTTAQANSSTTASS